MKGADYHWWTIPGGGGKIKFYFMGMIQSSMTFLTFRGKPQIPIIHRCKVIHHCAAIAVLSTHFNLVKRLKIKLHSGTTVSCKLCSTLTPCISMYFHLSTEQAFHWWTPSIRWMLVTRRQLIVVSFHHLFKEWTIPRYCLQWTPKSSILSKGMGWYSPGPSSCMWKFVLSEWDRNVDQNGEVGLVRNGRNVKKNRSQKRFRHRNCL